MNWGDVAKSLAKIGLPLLGTALGGPAGGAVAGMVASALGLGGDAKPEDVSVALGQVNGDQLVQLRQIEAETARKLIDQDTEIALAQVELNRAALAAPSGTGVERVFKSGWRPATAWVCVLSFAYMGLVRPLLPWFCTVVLGMGGESGVPDLPAIDTGAAVALLAGMLGLSTQRMFERLSGKA